MLPAQRVPAAAGLFTAVPQPNGGRATRKHANMANSFVHRPSSLGIEPRLQAQYELSTSVTCVDARSPKRQKELWQVLLVKLRNNSALAFEDILCSDATIFVPEDNELLKYQGHPHQGLLPHDRRPLNDTNRSPLVETL